jgi:tetratricopeptide (TPR) repeat protein
MKVAGIVLLLLSVPALSGAIDIREKGELMHSEEPTADELLSQADSVFQSHDYESALEGYRQALEPARREFNRSVEVEALSQMARMCLLLDRRDDGHEWLEQAAERASDSDPMGWSRYLGVKGRFEWQDNDLKAARETFDQMYVYCNTNALYGRAVDAAHMIAIVSEKPEDQIEWGKLGIEAAEKTDNEKWLGPLWNNLAGTYYDIQDFASALECYLKAREYHWRFSGEVAKLFADYHVGMTFRALGRLDEAAEWLRPVLAWAERLENHSAIGQTCEDLGDIEKAEGDKTRALELFKRARSEYKLEGFDKTWPEIWQGINERIEQLGG